MSKVSAKESVDELRPEYDLSQLKGGITGKYYQKAKAGSNLVLIEPELAGVFPDTESVNRALRLLVETAGEVMRPTRRKDLRPRKGARAASLPRTTTRRRAKSSASRKNVAV
jgi:hypothetical protein